MLRLRLTNTRNIQFTELLPLGSELHIGKERCCLRGLDQLHGPTLHPICGNPIPYKPFPTTFLGYPLKEVRGINPKGEFIPFESPLFRRDPSPLPRQGGAALLIKGQGARINAPFMFKHDESLCAIIDLLPIHFSASYGNGELNSFFRGEKSRMNREHNSCCFPLWWTMFPEKRFSFSNQETSTTKVAIHTNLFTDPYALMGTGSFETGWYTSIMKPPFTFRIRIGFILASLGGLRSFLRELAFARLNWNQKTHSVESGMA